MKSFLEGKKTLDAECLRPLAHFAGQAPHGGAPHLPAGGTSRLPSNAQVEVVKEGDKVVRLIVNCACGERVEIDCLYSAGR